MTRANRILVIGAVAAVLLQVLVAPNIAIFSVVPNFLMVYAIVAAMLVESDAVLVLAFLLGLLSDLLGYGPVGSLSLLLVLGAFAATRLHASFENGGVVVPLVILVVLCLAVDVLYALFLIGLSDAASPLSAFAYRALPSALYDCVLGILLYPIMSRLAASSQPDMRHVGHGPF